MAFCTVAGFCGGWFWLLGIFDHFRLHYAVGALLLGALAFAMARRRWAVVCLAVVLINLSLCPAIFSFVGKSNAPATAGSGIRVATLNVLTSNSRYADAMAVIRAEKPDVVVLLEVNDQWMTALAALGDDYRLLASRPREDNFGVAFFVRNAVDAAATIVDVGDFELPAVNATVNLSNGRKLRIFGLHTTPPKSPSYTANGRTMMDQAAVAIAGTEGPVAVLGDFNATPWSQEFRRFLSESGLQDSATGHGYIATWPTLASWLLRIPLDHCLVSPGITVARRWVGSEFGSDHLPLFVDLTVN